MRKAHEIQADIKGHHDEAKAKAVPVHFLHLINLQNEFNAAILAEQAAAAPTEGAAPAAETATTTAV